MYMNTKNNSFFKDTSEITEKQGTLLICIGKINKYLEMFWKTKDFAVYVS